MTTINESASILSDMNDGLLTITFNRPEAGNPIRSDDVPLLVDLFGKAQADPAVRAILVRGNGRHFSSGGDLADFAAKLEGPREQIQADFARRLEGANRLAAAVIGFDRPLVVAMRGVAAGGGLVFPLAADLAIGDPSARFLFSHQRVGLSPDTGVSYLLPQVVGLRRARTLMLTAARVDAEEAMRYGLLNEIAANEGFDERVESAARAMAQLAGLAAKNAKRLANTAGSVSLAEHLAAERDAIVACVAQDDFGEGVRAALERRVPCFGSAGTMA
ncbi:enoyl-CoA hydratase/isomerase family protein [Novosphingobium sp. 9U]|uniref:enoyl-CoA hydratase/isomerase family protein n=1 Tax=Novosphingobium sp. 9U TaxID=2653158 RepID=UPI0012EF1AD6|nr:enoyl-CoA hydratase-related protein [Novosphingobium sp. 9U]VWX50138.1 Enoyl-CoA hydratase [Novosphingobium sp. 9U]